MLDALNAIVSFLAGLVQTVAEFTAYSLTAMKFMWHSVELSLNFIDLIPEPFLHFAYFTIVLAVVGFCLKVVL